VKLFDGNLYSDTKYIDLVIKNDLPFFESDLPFNDVTVPIFKTKDYTLPSIKDPEGMTVTISLNDKGGKTIASFVKITTSDTKIEFVPNLWS
jgi:hypothetical protein